MSYCLLSIWDYGAKPKNVEKYQRDRELRQSWTGCCLLVSRNEKLTNNYLRERCNITTEYYGFGTNIWQRGTQPLYQLRRLLNSLLKTLLYSIVPSHFALDCFNRATCFFTYLMRSSLGSDSSCEYNITPRSQLTLHYCTEVKEACCWTKWPLRPKLIPVSVAWGG